MAKQVTVTFEAYKLGLGCLSFTLKTAPLYWPVGPPGHCVAEQHYQVYLNYGTLFQTGFILISAFKVVALLDSNTSLPIK